MNFYNHANKKSHFYNLDGTNYKFYKLLNYAASAAAQNEMSKSVVSALKDEDMTDALIKDKYKRVPPTQQIVPYGGRQMMPQDRQLYSNHFSFGMQKPKRVY